MGFALNRLAKFYGQCQGHRGGYRSDKSASIKTTNTSLTVNLRQRWHSHTGYCLHCVVQFLEYRQVNNTTGNTCENHCDCEPGKGCIDFQCEDPCLGLCGLNTICHVVGEVSICSCKPGFIGQPIKGCFPEVCTMNSDCPEEKICSDHLCKDVCKDACGLKSFCMSVKHRAICSCNPGYVWKQFLGCHVESRPPHLYRTDQCRPACCLASSWRRGKVLWNKYWVGILTSSERMGVAQVSRSAEVQLDK
ncbi:protein kinase C-binding protein NELL1-like [Homalodisca vitripennis]|uniref:protein kinase C-binding protein NELL1-like n=1 Tax=Homalodisca vitripennis TaxID=197043 RepID=UPI001EEC1C76|nr:protein kinase C-binding protein NELL1-like [Homalodisca vitripennis]